MILFLIISAIIAGVTYLWSARGFYSSLLNMVVTICSAVIAVSVWEPTAYWLMDQLTDQWLLDGVWGMALVVPFVIIQAVLSLAVNAVLRANVKVNSAADYVGGAVCGLVAGFMCAGIILQSGAMLRAKADAISEPMVIRESGSGAPVRSSGLLLPYDRMFGSLMSGLSATTFSTGTPLASWRPQFADEPYLLRMGPSDMFLKYSYKTGDAKLKGRYTVGKDAQLPLKDLVGDSKPVKTIDGEIVSPQSYVEGYVVQFGAGAREQGGQVVVGPGMFTLVMKNRQSDTVITAHPFAMVSQAKGESLDMGRWRFDTPEMYVSSAGAGSDPVMAFEFMIPRGDWVPMALYVRGIRHSLLDETVEPAKERAPSKQFASIAEYTDFYQGTGVIEFSGGTGQIVTEGSGKINTRRTEPGDLPLRDTNFIGDRFNKSYMNGLELDAKKQIINGEATLAAEAVLGVGTDKSLMVENFAAGDSSVIIRVDAGPKSRWFIRGDKSEGATGAPKLIDDKGQVFECIGYYYRRGNDIRVRFTPGRPVKDKAELPSISKTDDTIKFFLIFRVSLNTGIKQYAVGNTVLDELDPPLVYDKAQIPR